MENQSRGGNTPRRSASTPGKMSLQDYANRAVSAVNSAASTPLRKSSNNPQTVIYNAAVNNNVAIIRQALGDGVDVDAKYEDQMTPLMGAAEGGNHEVVEILADSGADLNAKEWTREDTALLLAVRGDHIQVIKLLAAKNADLEQKNRQGATAFMLAASLGKLSITEFLLEAKSNLEQRDRKGWTALMHASYRGQSEVVHMLVGRGSLIDYIAPSDGKNAIFCACAKGCANVVKVLVRHGADLNRAEKAAGETALITAVKQGFEETVAELLKGSPNIDQKDNKGWTAMMHASFAGCTNVVALLASALASGGSSGGSLKHPLFKDNLAAVQQQNQNAESNPSESPATPAGERETGVLGMLPLAKLVRQGSMGAMVDRAVDRATTHMDKGMGKLSRSLSMPASRFGKDAEAMVAPVQSKTQGIAELPTSTTSSLNDFLKPQAPQETKNNPGSHDPSSCSSAASGSQEVSTPQRKTTFTGSILGELLLDSDRKMQEKKVSSKNTQEEDRDVCGGGTGKGTNPFLEQLEKETDHTTTGPGAAPERATGSDSELMPPPPKVKVASREGTSTSTSTGTSTGTGTSTSTSTGTGLRSTRSTASNETPKEQKSTNPFAPVSAKNPFARPDQKEAASATSRDAAANSASSRKAEDRKAHPDVIQHGDTRFANLYKPLAPAKKQRGGGLGSSQRHAGKAASPHSKAYGSATGRTTSYDAGKRPIKVIIIGNAGVGKTNLLKVAIDCESGYSDSYPPSLDPEVATLSVPHPYDENAPDIQAQVWDTAGQERYMAVTKAQYRRADGALIVFDANSEKSFKAARTWVQQLDDIAGDTLLCKYLIENKVDLLPEGDVTNSDPGSRPEGFVPKADIDEFCHTHDMYCYHTSAKRDQQVKEWNGNRIYDVLQSLLLDIVERKSAVIPNWSETIQVSSVNGDGDGAECSRVQCC